MKPPMLTVQQAAQRVGCAAQALRRLMSEGRCPGAKIAGQWRIDEDALEAWLVEQRRESVNTKHEIAAVAGLPRLEHNPFL